jgi:hypothetical protein
LAWFVRFGVWWGVTSAAGASGEGGEPVVDALAEVVADVAAAAGERVLGSH